MIIYSKLQLKYCNIITAGFLRFCNKIIRNDINSFFTSSSFTISCLFKRKYTHLSTVNDDCFLAFFFLLISLLFINEIALWILLSKFNFCYYFYYSSHYYYFICSKFFFSLDWKNFISKTFEQFIKDRKRN